MRVRGAYGHPCCHRGELVVVSYVHDVTHLWRLQPSLRGPLTVLLACFLGKGVAPHREDKMSSNSREHLPTIRVGRRGICISVAIEVGVFDSSDMMNLKLVHDMPKMVGGHPSSVAPNPVQPTTVPSSPPKVQEIRSKEVTKKAIEVTSKRPTDKVLSQRKKAKVIGRH
ncbi:hypothetical protein GW17_00038951 [Ensete ventricosum]|nr:hypothetical protein GW17_00038951 [Ensete ventricosum]